MLQALWLSAIVGLSLLGLARPAAGQAGVVFPVNEDPWTYVAAPIPAHCAHTYRLYLPRPPHVKPANGWPVLIHVKLNGFHRSEDTPELAGDSFLARVLDQGIAVVVARVTPSIQASDPLWLEWCGAAPVLPGHGLFQPPGYVPHDLAAAGIAPYDAPDYHMAEKDCVMLIQHVKFGARQVDGLEGAEAKALALLDHEAVGVHGESAAAITLMWAVLGPDRRDALPFAGLSGQHAESSHVALAALEKGVVWWPAFHGSVKPTVSHFGLQGHSETPAPTLGAADPAVLFGASAMAYADEALVEDLPLYLSYGAPSESEQYQAKTHGCGQYPFCFDDQGLEGLGINVSGNDKLHPAWSGYAWATQHRGSPLELVIQSEPAYQQRKGLDAVPLFGDPTAQTPLEIEMMQQEHLIAWLRTQLDALQAAAAPPVWQDIGNGLAGSTGVPDLVGSGVPTPGAHVNFTLSGALAASPVGTVAGFSTANLPLLGGVLVPQPDLFTAAVLATDAQGGLSLGGVWPPGVASGTRVYVQVWTLDAGAPKGASASNAVRAVVP